MIQIAPAERRLVAVEPVDFRKGIDALARLCRQVLGSDPFSGTVFVFRNRRGTAVRILAYDGQGFWLAQGRLSEGRFRWWPSARGEPVGRLDPHEPELLLWNGNPAHAQAAPMWRRLAVGS